MTANLYGSESIEQYTFNRWAARVRKGLTYRSQSDAVIISYAGRKTPRFPVSEYRGKQDWWVTRSDVWVEFPSVRALLEVMRDKTMRQALAKSKKQAVESVKSSETLRFFDNALITMPFSHRSLLRRNKRAPMLLIVLLGVYIGRTGVAAPKQYRKTVQQQEVEPQIYESGYRLCLENTSKIFTIFVGSHEY